MEPIQVGDRVELLGQVLQVVPLGDGNTNCQVETESGAVWIQARHLKTAAAEKLRKPGKR